MPPLRTWKARMNTTADLLFLGAFVLTCAPIYGIAWYLLRRRRHLDVAARRTERIEELEWMLGMNQCECRLTKRDGVTLVCQLTAEQHGRNTRQHLDPVHGWWRPEPGERYDLRPPHNKPMPR